MNEQGVAQTLGSTQFVDVLLLGSGWISGFIIPILESESLSYNRTTRAGSPGSIPFEFDPGSPDPEQYLRLPCAAIVVIIFPLKGAGASRTLVEMYSKTHSSDRNVRFIQLGSTGIWPQNGLINRHTVPDLTHPRAIAENELLELGGAVLNLAGLWGPNRNPRDWISRIAPTKEALVKRTSLHVIHGIDVAWAIFSLTQKFTPGQRWIVTDLRVYDWWDLCNGWGDGGAYNPDKQGMQPGWVMELMEESGIKMLPRNREDSRQLDSFEFWRMAGRTPVKRLDVRLLCTTPSV